MHYTALCLLTVINLLLVPLLAVLPAPTAAKAGPLTRPDAMAAYSQLPLPFVRNEGQLEGPGDYYTLTGRSSVWFAPDGLTLQVNRGSQSMAQSVKDWRLENAANPLQSLSSPVPGPTQVRLKFVQANPAPLISADQRLTGRVNTYYGSDPARWRTGLPTYGRLTYYELWPGIDLSYEGRAGNLKSTFTVAPGADPFLIQVAYPGADSLNLDQQGSLVIRASNIELREAPPVAWQDISGRRRPVAVTYRLLDRHTYTFSLPAGYDPAYPLVIDPELIYSTFVGSADDSRAYGLAVDADGNAVVVLNTEATTNPAVLVFKLNAAGTDFIYSTAIGGSGRDVGQSLAIDSQGFVYIAGFTTSANFPASPGAADTSLNGSTDAFALKLSPAGERVYATYLGGQDIDRAFAIAVDSQNRAYVTGDTSSPDFPVTAGALDSTCGSDGICNPDGGYNTADAYVARFSANGDSLDYATFVGGNGYEIGLGIAVDSTGSAYLTGYTESTAGFPISPGAFDNSCGGCDPNSDDAFVDAFIVKLNSDGNSLAYGSYLGGTDAELAFDIAVDAAGHAYLTGRTYSTDFPGTPGAFQPGHSGGSCGTAPDIYPCTDAFVVKMKADGTGLEYATLLGGPAGEEGDGIIVNEVGQVYVTGYTDSGNFPVSPDALDHSFADGLCTMYGATTPCHDAFVVRLDNTGSNLLYGSFLGGSGHDGGFALALDSQHNLYVSGASASPDFPTTPGVPQPTFGGLTCGWEPYTYPCPQAFIAKFRHPVLHPEEIWPMSGYQVSQNQSITVHLENHLPAANPYDVYLGAGGQTYRICAAVNTDSQAQADVDCPVGLDIPLGGYDLFSTYSGQMTPLAMAPEQVEVTAALLPRLSISKSGPLSALPGQPITYTLTVTNTGNFTATGLVITDTMPAGGYYAGGGSRTGDVVSWTVPSLAAGGSTQASFVITATDTLTNSDYRVSAGDGISATGQIAVTTTVGDVPIAGLNAENSSPTLLGQVTTLTATVTAGTNISYTWTLGDGTLGSGRVISSTYPAAGIYTAVVTASNGAAVMTATSRVTITAEVDGRTFLPLIIKP